MDISNEFGRLKFCFRMKPPKFCGVAEFGRKIFTDGNVANLSDCAI